jgi:hypothetical protein
VSAEDRDLLGRGLDALEAEIVAIHARLVAFCRRSDLPPCASANALHAAAATWQILNDLGLPGDRIEELPPPA